MNKEKIVCSCKKISEETVINSIKNDAKMVEEVKGITGASSGLCRGFRCKKKIKALIEEYK